MFGRARDETELDVGDIFGDEHAAEEAARLDALRERVEQVESQLASQFTSLAAYAQIAQEQAELVRSEASAGVERTEQRLTALIERERTDRISTVTGEVPAGSAPDVMMRVESMERTIAKIARGLDDCLDRQLQLADAITKMFDHRGADRADGDLGVDLRPTLVDPSAERMVEPDLPELSMSLPPLPAAAPLPAPDDGDQVEAGTDDGDQVDAGTADGPIPALALD